ncbi:putative bifunctional diguanylate cyclase/phosphodiesterase [Noviherbaspirillum soli]|uniref:putative bifunctional diguanylate cyclase/phosphodiesterase n=1 Tax=Noviherbaspirillum soli TaxID=1064518 RepID=UPI00188A4CAD|nr:EAL domain-containing protein [Noviherbaspirillum soli]
MQRFDPRFLFFITALLSLLSFIILFVVIRRNFPRSIAGVSEWGWACGLMTVAATLFITRGIFPAGIFTNLTQLLANAAFFFAFWKMYISLLQFAGRAPINRNLLYAILVAIFLLAWFSFIDSFYSARVAVAMATIALLCFACAQIILKMRYTGITENFMLVVFVLLGAVSVARLGATIIGEEKTHFLENASLSQIAYFAVQSISIVAVTVGFMLMISRRLSETLGYLASRGEFNKFQSDERLDMQRALHQAVKNNELIMYYQPRTDVKSGAVIGLEALVRWNHPVFGLIGPGQFIALCEETNAMQPLGTWVLEHAVEFLNRLHGDVRPGVHVSVNVSARQFNSPELISDLERILKNAIFPTDQLELELTESALLQDPDGAEGAMRQMKKMGVLLAVDDFGTGYSSLSYLKRLPIDCMKIDYSFMKGIPGDSNDVAIVRAIIAMGHALGLKVVAEGVETQEQL